MRGSDAVQEALFMFAKLDDFVPTDHPLRAIQKLVNESRTRLNGLFNTIYADTGRASIAPEKLMRALLLQVFYSIRSERQLMEQTRYNLLFRWFVGLAIDDPVWDPSTFSENRNRLIEAERICLEKSFLDPLWRVQLELGKLLAKSDSTPEALARFSSARETIEQVLESMPDECRNSYCVAWRAVDLFAWIEDNIPVEPRG